MMSQLDQKDRAFFAHLRNPFPVPPASPPPPEVPPSDSDDDANPGDRSTQERPASWATVTTSCAVVSLDLSPTIPASALPDTFAQVASNFVTARHVSQGHEALCHLVDCVRGHVANSRRVYLVQEAHARTLSSILLASADGGSGGGGSGGGGSAGGLQDPARLLRWAHTILSGLAYLHAHGIQHRNLHLHNIVLVPSTAGTDEQEHVKLFNFATYFVTNNGAYVATPVTGFAVQPPEVVLLAPTDSPLSFSSFKADTWAFGLLLWHLYFGSPLLPTSDPRLLFATLADFCKQPQSAMHDHVTQRLRRFQLTRPHLAAAAASDQTDPIVQLILAALVIDPKHRPMPCDLLLHQVFHDLPHSPLPRSLGFGSPDQRTNLRVLFHLWLSAGGNLDAEYMRATGAVTRPAVLELPCELRAPRDAASSKPTSLARGSTAVLSGHDRFPFPLNLRPILEAIWHLTPVVAHTLSEPATHASSDTAVQFQRIQHLTWLLLAYPLSLPDLHAALRTSMTVSSSSSSSSSSATLIPPLLRPDLWLALLNVTGPVQFLFSTHDLAATAAAAADNADDTLARQLDADTLRCHTYHPYISSPLGQAHLQRLIRAWLHAHPTRVYWQGFDSVCAVFLSLFPGEPLLPYAFAALDAFVARFLDTCLQPDNHAVLQAHFARVRALLRYLDPDLAAHMLDAIGLEIDLFGVPWALTACAHVLPLPLVYLVWDYLLVAGADQKAFLVHVLVACLRAPTIRPGILQARSFDEALHRIVDVSLQDFTRALEGAKVQSRTMPKSTHDALMRDDEHHAAPAEVVMRISVQDALAESDAVRVIDVRFEALPPPGTLHIKSSTFVPPTNLHAIESILKQQRLNKRITVVRSLDPDEAARACKRLVAWGIAGVCWLEEEPGAPDDNNKVCTCTPTAISLPTGTGHATVYKCTH